jgi:hypothetical protein
LSGAEGRDVGGGHLLGDGGGIGDETQAGLGKDVDAEVAAALDPLVVVLGQDRADQGIRASR